jgi:peptidoglycan hydrolase CwlO-like protein
MKNSGLKYLLIFSIMLIIVTNGKGQTTLPEELTRNTIKEQIKYIEEKTRIYENYRAIREDMFQKINKNILDSLSAGKNKIAGLNNVISSLKQKNDSLKTSLETTKTTLEETTRTKNSIGVFGMNINKNVYNSIMWIVVAGLVLVLVIGFLVFKKILQANISTKKELKELRDEFEDYRQTTRIAREKMSMDHFNEIKKLKGI